MTKVNAASDFRDSKSWECQCLSEGCVLVQATAALLEQNRSVGLQKDQCSESLVLCSPSILEVSSSLG